MLQRPNVRRHRELVDLLLQEGILTEEKLTQARQESKRTGLNIERVLEKLGFVTAEQVVQVRADALGIPHMDLSDYIVDNALIKNIPAEVAKHYKMIPLYKIGNCLTVGMVDPQDIVALDHLRRFYQVEMIKSVLVSERSIERILEVAFEQRDTLEEIIRSIDSMKIVAEGAGEAAEEAPVIKIVNMLISQAVHDRASDIHVEPEADCLRVRTRIDGLLHEVAVLPQHLQNAITSRIKILAKLDIAESRRPQDGRIRLPVEERDLDIRVSTFPTVNGENVVLRLLDKSAVSFGLKEMGLNPRDLEAVNKIIRRPNGIILVTGPTGSGKTSSLYSILTTISSMEKNIITIEDPVEFEFPLIRQTPVNPKANLTFANGLRGILRQDPDVIMVGEIRDKETADIAMQAALTGHLVLSTLHTNDAPSALTRLLDMGVEPYLISSTVIGIIAQRLVKLICEKCKEEYNPPEEILRVLKVDAPGVFYRGRGCAFCKKTGYRGRTGIFELLGVTEEIKKMIAEQKTADEIKRQSQRLGMKTLRADGILKIQEGLTTAEEVLKVTEMEF